MNRKIKSFIEKQELLNPGAKVVVGLSGGSDSVVLLSVLHELGYECLSAHCNFHLREEESERDAKFASGFASSLNIPFFKTDFDTQSVAHEQGISVEMAARNLRYEWFEHLREESEAEAIAVAHHLDDSIETLILNLIRGTGINGLAGIKPRNKFIVRPLLCVNKEDILHYATTKQLPYVTDSSNLKDEFLRNKIRLQIIPLLQSIKPGVDVSLLRTMEHINEVLKIYNAHIDEAKARVFDADDQIIYIPALLSYPSPESVLFEILKEYGFGKEVIKDVYHALEKQPGKKFFSDKYMLIKGRDQLFLIPNEEKEQSSVFFIEESDKEIVSPLALRMSIEEKTDDIRFTTDKSIAYFDAGKLKFPLTLRKWQKGDFFFPFGMRGKKKLSDYFSDHKFTQTEKEKVWVLCSGNDIIWLVGHRTDNRFRIDKDTKKIDIIKLL
jgi:tRNA(Ile)-lysidine synthase